MESNSISRARLTEYTIALAKLGFILSIVIVLAYHHTWIHAETDSKECKSFDLSIDVEEIYWSADGQYIIFQLDGQDLEIATWSIDSSIVHVMQGIELYEVPLKWSNKPSEIAWNPDGDRVAIVDEQAVEVWDVTGDLLYILPVRSTGSAWSFDSSYLATQHFENFRTSLKIWDMSSGDLYWTLDDLFLKNFAWHYQDNMFAIPNQWGTENNPILGIQLYNVDNKTITTNLPLTDEYLEHTDIITLRDPIWSSNGELLVAEFDMQPIPPVAWRVDTQQMIDISLPLGTYWDIFDNYLAFKPASLETSEDQVIVWDIALDQETTKFNVESPLEIDWNPDGDVLAVRSYSEIYLCEFTEWESTN